MTEKLYDKDSFIKEFEATVIDSFPKADGFFTVLDQTAFFPEGGGQPSDIGFLNDIKVYDVQINDGIIYHYTAKQLQKGEKVKGVIDFNRRFDFMQQHSGEHIVSGIAHSIYGCENVGFHLGEDIVTLDFDKPLTKNEIDIIEYEANKRIYKNAAFSTYYPDTEALKTLSYRSKKELEGDIRIVEIEDTDRCACCAPHVKTAGEIGIIKLSGGEKLRGGIRLEIKCGMRAFNDYKIKAENTASISSALCVKQNETADAVKKLLNQIGELKSNLSNIKRSLVSEKVNNFSPEKDISLLFEDDMDIKELQHYADALYKKSGGIRGVMSEKTEGFAFVFCGEAAKLDIWFSSFKTNFNVKGGGRNGMVQGTVLAKKAEIINFISE